MDRPPTIWKPAREGNYQLGRRNPISRITFHVIVGDAPAALDRFQNTNDQVSATYVIGSDGVLYQCVQEQDTPYSDGNGDSNTRTISIEHAGALPSVPYTDTMYNTSAKLCAYLIEKYSIADFKRHRDVIDKSVYPGGTLCPDDLDVERIISQAQHLIEDESMNQGDVQNLYLSGWQRNATADELKTWVGRPMQDFFYTSGKNQYEWLWKQIKDRDAQLASAGNPKPLIPGIYKVGA